MEHSSTNSTFVNGFDEKFRLQTVYRNCLPYNAGRQEMPSKSRQSTRDNGRGSVVASICPSSRELDELRDQFRVAIDKYTAEGCIMRDLLLADADGRSLERKHAIAAQQKRLTHAQLRYEEARRRYVEMVLGSLAPSSASDDIA